VNLELGTGQTSRERSGVSYSFDGEAAIRSGYSVPCVEASVWVRPEVPISRGPGRSCIDRGAAIQGRISLRLTDALLGWPTPAPFKTVGVLGCGLTCSTVDSLPGMVVRHLGVAFTPMHLPVGGIAIGSLVWLFGSVPVSHGHQLSNNPTLMLVA